MPEVIAFLEKWQTLVGCILGGIFALSVALIVGRSVRRREEIASGMLLVGNLVDVRIAFETLRDLAKDEKIAEDKHPLWLVDRLVASFPSLSPLFEASIVRMLPISTNLAAHLTLFHKIYTGVGVMVDRIREDEKLLHEQGKLNRPKDHLEADVNLIHKHFPLAVQHAVCAEQLISDLILSKKRTFNRMRQRLWQLPREKECMKRLGKGSS